METIETTGKLGLLMLTIDEAMLGDALKWEEGEPGEHFPHLHGPLDVDAVTDVRELTVATWEA